MSSINTPSDLRINVRITQSLKNINSHHCTRNLPEPLLHEVIKAKNNNHKLYRNERNKPTNRPLIVFKTLQTPECTCKNAPTSKILVSLRGIIYSVIWQGHILGVPETLSAMWLFTELITNFESYCFLDTPVFLSIVSCT